MAKLGARNKSLVIVARHRGIARRRHLMARIARRQSSKLIGLVAAALGVSLAARRSSS